MENKKLLLLGLLSTIAVTTSVCSLFTFKERQLTRAATTTSTYQIIVPMNMSEEPQTYYTGYDNPIEFYNCWNESGITIYNKDPFSAVDKLELCITSDYEVPNSAYYTNMKYRFVFLYEEYSSSTKTTLGERSSISKGKNLEINAHNYSDGNYFYCWFSEEFYGRSDKLIITYSC